MLPNTKMYVSNLEIAIGTTLAFSQGFTVIIKQSQTIKTDHQFLSHWFLILYMQQENLVACYVVKFQEPNIIKMTW